MATNFLIAGIGSNLKSRKDRFVNFISFSLEVISSIVKLKELKRIGFSVLIRQILFTGYEALGIIGLISIAIGGIIILEGNFILASFGRSSLLYSILVSVVTRELGCLLTAFIIIARSGTAISTELGNMVINQEVDALLSFGISPITYLIIPRVFGVVISSIALSVYFNITALLGGWIISQFFYPIDFRDFLYGIFSELSIIDIIFSLIKALSFGFAIATIASYQGLQVSIATTEVPQRTIKATVLSLGSVIVIDVLITIIFYFI